MAEVALRVVGQPIVLRIDADVWRAWGQRGPIECVLERLADEGSEGGEAGWLTQKQAAAELCKDLGWDGKRGTDQKRAYARISNELRSRGCTIKDNGKSGPARRIDRTTFDAWRLKQRDLAAKRDGWDTEEEDE